MEKKATMSAFLAEGTNFEGRVKFSGILRIDGRIKGDILDGSTLFVGDKAVIEGNIIHTTHVVLTGEIRGNIVAEQVEVRPPGKVFGNIEARTALIDEGAVFVGKCRIFRPKETPRESGKAWKRVPGALFRKKGKKDAQSGKRTPSPVWTGESIKQVDKQDTLGPFFQDCCDISSGDQVQAQPLYLVYREWCVSNGKQPLTSVLFGKMMTEKFEKVDLAGKRFYKGIRMTADSLPSRFLFRLMKSVQALLDFIKAIGGMLPWSKTHPTMNWKKRQKRLKRK
ncbi:MAG: hypothetical protein GY849_14990 [Deltaproteobacteria bacterium]|nr:hypothetical protein [Deltaproteobacteria bacterium]